MKEGLAKQLMSIESIPGLAGTSAFFTFKKDKPIFMEKKITEKQVTRALINYLKLSQKATTRLLKILENNDSTQAQRDAAANVSNRLLEEARKKFDEIDKLYRTQQK